MSAKFRIQFYIALASCAFGMAAGSLQLNAAADDAYRIEIPKNMATAADAWLASLDTEQRLKAKLAFDDERADWHYVPRGRSGLALGEMTDPQRGLAFALLREGMSAQGVEQAEGVIELEGILRGLEGRIRFNSRDPGRYYVAVFGEPGPEPWGWRIEGHHLSINATVVEGVGVAMTPSFVGANPAEVPSGPRQGWRLLASEEDVAFELVHSLNTEQRANAVFQTLAPRDIFTAAQRSVRPLPLEGLGYDQMGPEQQGLLVQLVDVFLLRNRPEIYAKARQRIEAEGWGKLKFGWAGSLERRGGNYYYVQGASFLIEYDNVQNDGNHIHTVWREFDGDFGGDLLLRHRENHEH